MRCVPFALAALAAVAVPTVAEAADPAVAPVQALDDGLIAIMKASKAAGVKGNPGRYFGPDAYPPAAIRAGAQGRVVAKLTVGTDGRVSNCVVETSSGNNDLDETTCRIARSRVRFTPAQDQNGSPIVSSYTLPVRWVLPEE